MGRLDKLGQTGRGSEMGQAGRGSEMGQTERGSEGSMWCLPRPCQTRQGAGATRVLTRGLISGGSDEGLGLPRP